MEFFRILPVNTSERVLHGFLTPNNVDKISNLIFPLGESFEDQVEIGGLWGEFSLLHSRIKGGVRFALKECPNALAWTVTTGYPPDPESVVVHLTINRMTKAASTGPYLVQILEADPARVEQIRAVIRKTGEYGRISAVIWPGRRLPHADNLVNVLICAQSEHRPMK